MYSSYHEVLLCVMCQLVTGVLYGFNIRSFNSVRHQILTSQVTASLWLNSFLFSTITFWDRSQNLLLTIRTQPLVTQASYINTCHSNVCLTCDILTQEVMRLISYSCSRPWRPIGLWDIEAPTVSLDNRLTDGGKVVSLMCRPLETESTPGP
jgi:hypothetical protein